MRGPSNRWLPGAVAALLLAQPGPARSEPGCWQLVAHSTVGREVSNALFVDERTGFAAHCVVGAAHGALLRTEDRGSTWTAAGVDSVCLFGLEATRTEAWCTGDRGDVHRSADGGRTWTRADPSGRAVATHADWLSFVDAGRGAAASHSDVRVTEDGGSTWSPVRLPEHIDSVGGVSLSPSSEGTGTVLRLFNPAGTMWASRDAGATWTVVPTPLRRPLFEWGDGVHAVLRFPSAREGILVAMVEEDEGPRGRVYRTVDGGQTWTEEQVEGGLWPSPVAISSDGELITSLDRGAIRLYRRTRGPVDQPPAPVP